MANDAPDTQSSNPNASMAAYVSCHSASATSGTSVKLSTATNVPEPPRRSVSTPNGTRSTDPRSTGTATMVESWELAEAEVVLQIGAQRAE